MIRTCAKILTLLSFLIVDGCDQMTDVKNTARENAEAAIGEVLAARGAKFEGLPDSNVAAVGPLALAYRPQDSQITVSVLIAEFTAWTLFPDRRPKLEQTVAALKDPAIGGQFQTDNAEWMFNRETGKLALGYRSPTTASAAELTRAVEALEPLYPEWSLNWMGAVADIVHEGKPVPADKVTLENNPYR